jgi:hypothetical protein
MDGITGVSSGALDIAANGTSAVAMAVLAGTERLMAEEVARLFSSLGIGSNFSASA